MTRLSSARSFSSLAVPAGWRRATATAVRLLLGGLPALMLAACAVEPPHRPPTLDLPGDFRYVDGWQRTDATPQPVAADWWAPYDDPVLGRLLRDVAQANATVAQARARHQQALTQIDAARAGALPTVDGTAGFTRANRSTFGTRLYQAGLTIAWAPDIWGRAALATDAARADAEAAAADLDAARLALQLTASQGYVRLRALDLHQELLTRSLTAYDRSLQLTRRQHEAGLVARSDVIQAETQLQALRAQQVSTARQRLLEENALALLAGRTPSELRLERRPGALPAVPATPAELPSAVLVRRPDVAAAERQIAAVHARLGLARRAWLPTLSLGATGGVQSSRWRDLLDAPARVWSLGPSLAASFLMAACAVPRARGWPRSTTSRSRYGGPASSMAYARPRMRSRRCRRWPRRAPSNSASSIWPSTTSASSLTATRPARSPFSKWPRPRTCRCKAAAPRSTSRPSAFWPACG